MAYDEPKAAHFELRDSDGFEILTSDGINFRWSVAAIVSKDFPSLMMLKSEAVAEIDKICKSLSKNGLNISFRHHRQFH